MRLQWNGPPTSSARLLVGVGYGPLRAPSTGDSGRAQPTAWTSGPQRAEVLADGPAISIASGAPRPGATLNDVPGAVFQVLRSSATPVGVSLGYS
jgi:hypothetical protein